MDQEVEEISRVLLQKTGDSSEFIQKAADQSLGVLARSVTPSRALAAFMANGAKYVISFAFTTSIPSGHGTLIPFLTFRRNYIRASDSAIGQSDPWPHERC